MEKKLETVFEALQMLNKLQDNQKSLGDLGINRDSLKKIGANLVTVMVAISTNMANAAQRDLSQTTIDFKSETEDTKDRTITTKVETKSLKVTAPVATAEKGANIRGEEQVASSDGHSSAEVAATTTVENAPGDSVDKTTTENKLGEESASTETVATEEVPAATEEATSSENTGEETSAATSEEHSTTATETAPVVEVSAEGRYATEGEAIQALLEPVKVEARKGKSFNDGKFRNWIHDIIKSTFPVGSQHIIDSGDDAEAARKQRNKVIDYLNIEVTRALKEERLAKKNQKKENKQEEPSKSTSAVGEAAKVIASAEGKDIVAPAAPAKNAVVVTPQQIASAINNESTASVELTEEDTKMLNPSVSWSECKEYVVKGLTTRNVRTMSDAGIQWALEFLKKRGAADVWLLQEKPNRTTKKVELELYNWLERQISNLAKAS